MEPLGSATSFIYQGDFIGDSGEYIQTKKMCDMEDPKEQFSGTEVCGCGGNAEGNVGSKTEG